MKWNKCSFFMSVVALSVCGAAKADLEREFTYSLPHDTPEASYGKALRHFDGFTTQTFFPCIGRVAGQSSGPITSGDFMITFNPDKSATVSWDFTETDHIFLGVYVAGGPGGGNLYENIPEMEGDEFRGTAEVDATRRKNGTLAAISHIDFFCGRDEPVPDEGPTLFLFSDTLVGLIFIRRWLGRGLTGCG
jgi:hypothetical protein